MLQFWMELAPPTMFSATWCKIFVGPFLQESHWPNSTSLNHPRNIPSCSAKIHRFTQIFAQVISPTARRQSKIMQQFLCMLFPRFSFPNHRTIHQNLFHGTWDLRTLPWLLEFSKKSAHQNGHVTSIRQNLRLFCALPPRCIPMWPAGLLRSAPSSQSVPWTIRRLRCWKFYGKDVSRKTQNRTHGPRTPKKSEYLS